MSLVVETIRHREGFDSLREDWEALASLQPERSPFLSHDWFRCCLEDAAGLELFVITAREGNRLVGIAPLCRESVRARWRRARAIRFIGCRETPFADFLVDPDQHGEVLDALLRHLHSTERAAWDLLVLSPWSESSANLAQARGSLAALGARRMERQASLVPVISMGASWEDFWTGRSYLFRKSRRGVLKRMQRLGTVEVECHRADPAGELIRTVFEISDRSWKRAEGKAVTSREESKRFFRALTATAGRRGWLLVWVLRVNGEPVATEYDLSSDGNVYALRADFDQAHATHSPGAYLEYHLLQRLFSEGYRAYHAGPGSDAYKLRWTEEQRRYLTVTVFNRSPGMMLLWWAEEWAIPRLKDVRDRFSRGERPGHA